MLMPAQTCTNYACNLQVYVLKDQEAFQEIYKLLPEKYFNILEFSSSTTTQPDTSGKYERWLKIYI